MGILVQCACGKEYTVPVNQPGKRFRCYRCARKLRAGDAAAPDREAIVATAVPGAAIMTRAEAAGSATEPADDVVMAELWLRQRALRDKAAFRTKLGLGFMIGGAMLCLSGLVVTYDVTRLADASPGGYISGIRLTMATGPIVLGAVVFLWGFKRWYVR